MTTENVWVVGYFDGKGEEFMGVFSSRDKAVNHLPLGCKHKADWFDTHKICYILRECNVDEPLLDENVYAYVEPRSKK